MVERQLRRRGIDDERVLAAMAEVPRELFVPERPAPPRLPRRRAADRRGPDDLAAVDRGLHGPAARAARRRAVLEVGTGSGYAAAVLSRLCARGRDDRALREPRRRRAARRSPSSATTTSRCAWATARAGAPDRAPFGGISVTATAPSEPPPPLLEQLAPGAALVCPVERGRREHLMRFRDGERGGGRRRALRAAREREEDDPRVLRRRRGGAAHARAPVRGGRAACATRSSRCRRATRTATSRPRDAAGARCARRPALEAELVEKLGDIRYWYARDGERVMKIVAFFLFRYRSGSVADHDHEVEEARLDPARGGAGAARVQGRAGDGRGRAVAAGRRPLGCRRRVRPQLLLAGLRRPAQARPQDRDDPPGRQEQEVPQGRGRADHGRLPALAARADLRGRDRLGRGQARGRAVAARHRARQPRVPPPRRDGALPRADLRPQGRDGGHRHGRALLADLGPPVGDPASACARTGPPRTSRLGLSTAVWHSRC